MSDRAGVGELRLVVTTDDFDGALHAFRDLLGMRELGPFESPDGRVAILDAGRATLELADAGHAAYVDRVEVGRRVAGPIRVALALSDPAEAVTRLEGAGATVIARPTRTPWGSLNARLEGPAGLQLTLFGDEEPAG